MHMQVKLVLPLSTLSVLFSALTIQVVISFLAITPVLEQSTGDKAKTWTSFSCTPNNGSGLVGNWTVASMTNPEDFFVKLYL